jgi:ABC-type phosphate transport system permease subunit
MVQETPLVLSIAYIVYLIAIVVILLLALIRVRMTRRITERTAFAFLACAAFLTLVPVLFIIAYTVIKGGGAISWDFLTQFPSKAGKEGGILPAIIGTLYLMFGTLFFSLPMGILAGVFLQNMLATAADTFKSFGHC